MIGTSTLEYVFIRTCITGLRTITPLSILYYVSRPFQPHRLPLIIGAWFMAETAFYFLVYLPRRWDSSASCRSSTSNLSIRAERALPSLHRAYSGPGSILGKMVQGCSFVGDQTGERERILQMGVPEHRGFRSDRRSGAGGVC